MRRLSLLLLVSSSSALAASPLTYRVFPPAQPEAGQPLTFSILLTNTGTAPVAFNTALCPQVSVSDIVRKTTVRTPAACAKPLMNVTVPAGGHEVYALHTGLILPSGRYAATIRLDDTTNGHQARLQTAFRVVLPPQVVEQLQLPPVMRAAASFTVTVMTRNLSKTAFEQDLRLCPTTFLIRNHRGQTVFETPATQACTTDLKVTALPPGAAHLEAWRIDRRLAPGRYELLHWGWGRASVTIFEVVK